MMHSACQAHTPCCTAKAEASMLSAPSPSAQYPPAVAATLATQQRCSTPMPASPCLPLPATPAPHQPTRPCPASPLTDPSNQPPDLSPGESPRATASAFWGKQQGCPPQGYMHIWMGRFKTWRKRFFVATTPGGAPALRTGCAALHCAGLPKCFFDLLSAHPARTHHPPPPPILQASLCSTRAAAARAKPPPSA
jgi:hypothetical protein